MKKKLLKYGGTLLLLIGIALCFVCLWLGLTIIGIVLLAASALFVLLLLNKALKQTNWYKNVFIYTKQMCSNAGYRDYLIRNLDIVNVGSNPARFAFHYDSVLGENWSTGNQGKDMDFEILKFRHSFLKRGGTVLLPIIPFSGVAGFLKENRPEYLGVKYYAKFAHTLDHGQAYKIPECRKAFKWIKYPLFYEPKAIRYLFFDQKEDNRLCIAEQSMMRPQLIEDARHKIESWLKEFNLKSLDDELSEDLANGIDKSVKTMRSIIDYLEERELRPVIVLLPMSEPLQKYFTTNIKQRFVYDFVKKIKRPEVLFLDYSNNRDLQNPQLYFDSLFLNLRGRKLFTHQVLADLGLIDSTSTAAFQG